MWLIATVPRTQPPLSVLPEWQATLEAQSFRFSQYRVSQPHSPTSQTSLVLHVIVFEGLTIGWASSLLVFITVALALFPFAFSRYGERLRVMGKYKG
jgi:hypothetical protein